MWESLCASLNSLRSDVVIPIDDVMNKNPESFGSLSKIGLVFSLIMSYYLIVLSRRVGSLIINWPQYLACADYMQLSVGLIEITQAEGILSEIGKRLADTSGGSMDCYSL